MSCCPTCDLKSEYRRVAVSPLLRAGGLATYRGLFDAASLRSMLQEASSADARLDIQEPGQDTEQIRGGTPARRLYSVHGGAVQDAFFTSPELSQFVSQKVDAPVRPCGARASYSFYSGEGAHLDIHRDVQGCDLALITCLHDSNPDAFGGCMDLWFDDALTPLGRVRADPNVGYTRVALQVGDSLLMHGGIIPHRIVPISGLRVRVVSLMCFGIAMY